MKASFAANLLYFPITQLAGEPIRRYLNEYREHDTVSLEALCGMQSAALRRIIQHAEQSTAHYRKSIGRRSDAFPSVFSELDGIEPVGKAILRENPRAFASSRAPGRLQRKTTSGSTGHPLTVLKNRDAWPGNARPPGAPMVGQGFPWRHPRVSCGEFHILPPGACAPGAGFPRQQEKTLDVRCQRC
jgi:hypothetical protein